jgi:hypothetical protein
LFNAPETLTAARHGSLRLNPVDDYRFAAEERQIPLVQSELAEAAKHFPIIFPRGETIRPIALLGLRDNDNRFVDDAGRWTADYVPAHIRRYPLIAGESVEQYLVMIDRQAPSLREDKGEPLFQGPTDSGESAQLTERGQAAVDFLQRFQQEITGMPRRFAPLAEQGVLVDTSLDIRRNGKIVQRVNGFRRVDRQKLANLDDATLAAWARSGLLEASYLHLQSLGNLRRLAQ